MKTRTFSVVLVTAALALAACDGVGGGNATSPPVPTSPVITPVQTSSPSASVTPPDVPAGPRPTSRPVSATCTVGWSTPAEGTRGFTDPLGIVRRTTGVKGPLVVVDMRYFEGPEAPPSEQAYLRVIRRWYIKLYAKHDISFQGRFLVESRLFGWGLAAVAPYDTHGFRSPNWIGFQYDEAHLAPQAYEGLPGEWSGIPYDFVKGGEGLNIPGLPSEVVGCLRGT